MSGEVVTRPEPNTMPPETRAPAQFWLVGQFRAETPAGMVWDFQGIFDSREKAIAACRNKNYFIAPVFPNLEVPDETETLPGCVYPLIEEV